WAKLQVETVMVPLSAARATVARPGREMATAVAAAPATSRLRSIRRWVTSLPATNILLVGEPAPPIERDDPDYFATARNGVTVQPTNTVVNWSKFRTFSKSLRQLGRGDEPRKGHTKSLRLTTGHRLP